ncbi:Cycloartenol Synthase [Seminavis robusta]|uniref:Cycloartenol Synthase n=1 Tax=Seminavis robusta TaxID=568900 RepID=A0A9N8HWQ2_9STRA|nr:Cycloartenol Synthase [Seminavis robusta]|eukprot:Sro2747_g336140.1 Cycloartenol Synthase (977) ;mRNA; f:720-4175
MSSELVCYSGHEILPLICCLAFAILVTSCFSCFSFQGTPPIKLGKRPLGNGLWSYLLDYYQSSVGVWGYDPVQGAFAAPLRLRFHMVGWLILWASLLTVTPFDSRKCLSSKFRIPLSVLQSGVVSLFLYSFFQYIVNHFLPPVSHPGGACEHKIRRIPQWTDTTTELPAFATQNWRCAVAEESHDISEKRFEGTTAALTGEPLGRQMWTNQPKSNGKSDTTTDDKQEELIKEMAAGGRTDKPGTFNPSKNPNSCDQLFRANQIRSYLAKPGNQAPDNSTEKQKSVKEALHKAAHFYSMLQMDDGHWGGDYAGPHFLMPGLIVVWYIMGKPTLMMDEQAQQLMKHYILVHQQSDGGWGTHIESPSTMFGTTLMYVAMRLLGVPEDDSAAVAGRKFLHAQGGAIMTSSWAKFYLCLLGVMDWKAHNSVPPEMWLLPNFTPFHPGRMWCHARMVYLPMSYLYSRRYVYTQAKTDPVISSLRKELYVEQDYDTIPWSSTRHWVAPMDNYSPIPPLMKFIQNVLACYENWAVFQPFKNFVRRYANDFCADYMAVEDLQTNYIDIGPVNKVLNMLSAFEVADSDLQNQHVMNHMLRVQDYLWIADDGMKMQGYNGSQLWDTAFAMQAYNEADLLDEFPEVSKKAWTYFERSQLLCSEAAQASPAYKYESAELRKQYYRHVSEGGWPFSTSAQGWPISDCTADGLKGVLCLLKSKAVQEGVNKNTLKPIDGERLGKAISVILSYQNEDGGWATYENNRGFGWYESLNPSEAFGDIMIDYSYVECSMACLTALYEFQQRFPKTRCREVQHSMDNGRNFLKSIQREDGSWYGSWAICFCNGTWFGIEGLVKSGEPLDSVPLQKACHFLLKQQRPNGGWGEDFSSCLDKDYGQNGMDTYGDEGSSVVNTSWALLALACAECKDTEAIKRGIQYLMKRQLPCGDWPQEGILGVFNRSCGITYTSYRNVFPIWAMGRCQSVYGKQLDE